MIFKVLKSFEKAIRTSLLKVPTISLKSNMKMLLQTVLNYTQAMCKFQQH